MLFSSWIFFARSSQSPPPPPCPRDMAGGEADDKIICVLSGTSKRGWTLAMLSWVVSGSPIDGLAPRSSHSFFFNPTVQAMRPLAT